MRDTTTWSRQAIVLETLSILNGYVRAYSVPQRAQFLYGQTMCMYRMNNSHRFYTENFTCSILTLRDASNDGHDNNAGIQPQAEYTPYRNKLVRWQLTRS